MLSMLPGAVCAVRGARLALSRGGAGSQFAYGICASVARSSDRQRLQIGSNITENRQHGFELD